MIVINSLGLGPDHVNELGLLVDTTNNLQSQGQYKMAEQIIGRTLKLYQKANGNEHSDTLRSMKLLGDILIDWEKYNDTEELLRKVLVMTERTLGAARVLVINS